MLAIPAIDILSGRVTRLHKGDFAQAKFYDKTPLDWAKKLDSIGAVWLHIVDLAASLDGKISVAELINDIKASTKLKIEFGGGIKTFESAVKAFETGVDRIVIGSISVSHKDVFEKIVNKYGSEKIVAAADSNNEMILIKGWTEKSSVSLWQHIEYGTSLGLQYFLCTDISKDGTLMGPNIEMYNRILEKHPQIKLIASGGVGTADDLFKLYQTKVYAAVVGKAIYENKITLEELTPFVS
ncbi:MAG: 1-(5-phosphoribosyl)-5-((5-phosphoribosylamino)methylideneamino) imidazole-4-carboxamide isomerase [Ignavibacteria bacterium]|nr:MAG: 1-(5-phosphoribosyl)-5-((5-phosphoribosylamino)methylideneamino) imidazole-4-carboxamide isomerase [Ignavibacteria bacterium]KAF0159900.1 MAG: 1-(5-phosphoribosyl)-5-((5-phosphoribosylamino)methylideneamino) imidazole-4-carboxamide isomerase [Ignavibacteria bacterium]